MAIISIGHRPTLTIEEAREIFAKGLAGRYEIVTTTVRSRHFIVRKDGWAGVGVKLQQQKDGTRFVYTAMIPNIWLQFFFGGMFSYMVLRATWKQLEAEIGEFIENAPEFRPSGEYLDKAA